MAHAVNHAVYGLANSIVAIGAAGMALGMMNRKRKAAPKKRTTRRRKATARKKSPAKRR